MTAYAVDHDPAPEDSVAERRDAIGRRLRHDPGVGAIATVDHGKLRKGGNLTANERGTFNAGGQAAADL